jgi:hypothetical protein
LSYRTPFPLKKVFTNFHIKKIFGPTCKGEIFARILGLEFFGKRKFGPISEREILAESPGEIFLAKGNFDRIPE